MAQAKNSTSKTEVSASVLKAALKAMQTLKIDRVHVSADGYIFPKACDARAYVGKDGSYLTLTKADCTPKPVQDEKDKKSGKADVKQVAKEVVTVSEQAQSTTNDPLIDEHKKEE